MVRGIEKFKEYFTDYADNYIIIGGTACDILLIIFCRQILSEQKRSLPLYF
jgi:hypothetical protein